jgi:hypothetical protein
LAWRDEVDRRTALAWSNPFVSWRHVRLGERGEPGVEIDGRLDVKGCSVSRVHVVLRSGRSRSRVE